MRLALHRPSAATRVAALVFLLCFIAHVVYVSLYAQEVPFWDQWDAEGDHLLRPFLESSLSFHDLLTPHNEHRIFFSRLLALALFRLNGDEWNNLVEAYASCAVYAAVPATLIYFASRRDSSGAQTAMIALAACVLATLPFDYENTLFGFQSQFYFMAEFALLLLATVSLGQPGWRTCAGIGMFGLMSLFTMASGVLAPVVAIPLLWSNREARAHRGFVIVATILLLGLVALGIALLPNLPSSDNTPFGIAGHIHALSTTLMWPLRARGGSAWQETRKVLCAILIWAPLLLWAIRQIRLRRPTPSELFVVATAAWVGLQAAAIAHARGRDMLGVSPRYTDILAVGLLCNAWLAYRLATEWDQRRWLARVVAGLFVLTAAAGFAKRTGPDHFEARSAGERGAVQTANVARYLQTNDTQWLQQPQLGIPYPDPKRLQLLLENPAIRSTLPVSLVGDSANGTRPYHRDGRLSRWARCMQHAVRRSP